MTDGVLPPNDDYYEPELTARSGKLKGQIKLATQGRLWNVVKMDDLKVQLCDNMVSRQCFIQKTVLRYLLFINKNSLMSHKCTGAQSSFYHFLASC